jgi:hypothetical protein
MSAETLCSFIFMFLYNLPLDTAPPLTMGLHFENVSLSFMNGIYYLPHGNHMIYI